jgi:hypothetical protein
MHCALKAYGNGGIDPRFLDLYTNWICVAASPIRYTVGKQLLVPCVYNDWVTLKAGLDDTEFKCNVFSVARVVFVLLLCMVCYCV